MNRNFGKLENAVLKYAPSVLNGETGLITRPTAADYLAAGWKALDLSSPTDPAPTGYHYEADGWEETDTAIKRKWKTVADPVIAKRYSVPDLFFWLRGYDAEHTAAPKGQAVKDWLDAANFYTIAVTTRVVSADNELFEPTLAAIKAAVGFTDEEISAALAYAETNAEPDSAA